MKVTRFKEADRATWNNFVRHSKNGTFLFLRDYLDYHGDRFTDHSLMFWDDRDRLLALLPANQQGEVLHSHAGLTYGGVISDDRMTTACMLTVFDALVGHMRSTGLARLRYKTVPSMYHRLPAEEDRYALFRLGASAYRRDVLSVIHSDSRLPFRTLRKRGLAAAGRHRLVTRQSTDLGAFWNLLEENLLRSHNTRPVHSIDEIRLLQSRFPGNIHLHLCLEGEEPVAGELIYDTPLVAHVQYSSASERGKQIGAQDMLLANLIDLRYSHRRFFDLGCSNEAEGRVLNTGLVWYKESFGARTVVHDSYDWTVQ